jgi:hypothetical protein
MEIDEEDILVLHDESEGTFGLKIKNEPEPQPENAQTFEELFQAIDDCLKDSVPETKYKYGFRVKKRIEAPATSSVASSTVCNIVPLEPNEAVYSVTPVVPNTTFVALTKPNTSARSSTATSSTPMDTMPTLLNAHSDTVVETGLNVASGINDNLKARLGPPVTPVRSRLGPAPDREAVYHSPQEERSRPLQRSPHRSPTRSRSPLNQLQGSSVSNTQQIKRPRGPDRRNQRDKAAIRAALQDLKHIPRLERVPIRRPYQWAPHDDPECPEEEEESFSDDPYTRSQDEKYVRSDAAWKVMYHKERTVREYAEWFVSDRTPVLLPRLSLTDAQRQVDTRYFVGSTVKQSVHEFFEQTHVSADDRCIKEFVREVRENGFMSFDTEGAGKLPSRTSGNQNANRLFVALSSPRTATVFLFHDALDIPCVVLELLGDYSIAKIQSGVCGDVELMNQVGIDVRGVVDSGTLLLLVNPGPADEGFGAKIQIKTIWPDKDCHVPYEWKTFGKAFNAQNLTPRAKRHVVQDVLTPFALLFTAAIKRTLRDKGDERDIMPLVQEALELTYTKEPKDIRQHLDGRSSREFWIPPVHGSEFSLNSRGEMTLIRRARGHLVERFPGPLLDEREHSAADIWRNCEIPCQRHIVFKTSNWCFRMSQWCQNCSSQGHKTSRCPRSMVPCPVHHYEQIAHPPHSALMCPQLHSYCHVCKMRGHLEQLHPELKFTPRQLRADFMEFCHLGLYTSLPYLYEEGGPIQNFHWKATVLACRLTRGQPDLWLYRGLSIQLPQDIVEARRAKQDVVRKNLDSTPSTYQTVRI